MSRDITMWQVQDSNLRSFRDGFTVRPSWRLSGQALLDVLRSCWSGRWLRRLREAVLKLLRALCGRCRAPQPLFADTHQVKTAEVVLRDLDSWSWPPISRPQS